MIHLDDLHTDIWTQLTKYLGLQDKKNLKLVNKKVYRSVTEEDKSLTHAYRKHAIRPAQLKQLADECYNLTGLECTLRDVEGLGEAMKYLCEKHPDIKKIEIGLYQVTPAQLKQIANDCPILTGLECRFVKRISKGTGEAMTYLREKHPEQEKIDISFSPGHVSSCLEELAELDLKGANPSDRAYPQLTRLDLQHCSDLTDSSLDAILLQYGSTLKDLGLKCTKISGTGITAVCPNLKKLDLTDCYHLTDSGP